MRRNYLPPLVVAHFRRVIVPSLACGRLYNLLVSDDLPTLIRQLTAYRAASGKIGCNGLLSSALDAALFFCCRRRITWGLSRFSQRENGTVPLANRASRPDPVSGGHSLPSAVVHARRDCPSVMNSMFRKTRTSEGFGFRPWGKGISAVGLLLPELRSYCVRRSLSLLR